LANEDVLGSIFSEVEVDSNILRVSLKEIFAGISDSSKFSISISGSVLSILGRLEPGARSLYSTKLVHK
jgi:hypothetical protein